MVLAWEESLVIWTASLFFNNFLMFFVWLFVVVVTLNGFKSQIPTPSKSINRLIRSTIIIANLQCQALRNENQFCSLAGSCHYAREFIAWQHCQNWGLGCQISYVWLGGWKNFWNVCCWFASGCASGLWYLDLDSTNSSKTLVLMISWLSFQGINIREMLAGAALMDEANRTTVVWWLLYRFFCQIQYFNAILPILRSTHSRKYFILVWR